MLDSATSQKPSFYHFRHWASETQILAGKFTNRGMAQYRCSELDHDTLAGGESVSPEHAAMSYTVGF